jgi:hypothetical protein
MINTLISSFNAGELSPLLEARSTLEKYRNGCRVLENFVITPYGPANRRAGLRYRGAAKVETSRCRLFGLNLTEQTRIIMELGVGYMRFWKNGILIENAGIPVEPTPVDYRGNTIVGPPHPYQEADLRDVRICQVNNVVFFTHPLYAPMRLSRFSDTNWTMGELPWAWAPMLDINTSTTSLTPSSTRSSGAAVTAANFGIGTTYTIASIGTTNFTLIGAASNTVGLSFKATGIGVGTGTATPTAITVTASSAVFTANHVGSYFQIEHAPPDSFLTQNITANITSGTINILGKWQLQSFGTWNANVDLQASTDGGITWVTRKDIVSRNDFNVITTGSETVTTLFRFVVSGWVTATSSTVPRIQITSVESTLRGMVRITGFTSSTSVTATVVNELGDSTATTVWREGAFSNAQGFPSVVALHESRLWFGGTTFLPNSLWASKSNDFQNYLQGPLDDESLFLTLATTTGGRLQWLVSKSSLLIGTTLDEWSLAASDSSRPLTPTNINAQVQSNYGSTSLPALVVNDTVLYVQRMSRKIRELIYTFSSETWVSNDITALAEHTTRTHIVEVAYQRVPDAIYWFVRGDGQLVSLTYEREQQVVGFSRHTTDGIFESVASINGADGEDEVWVSVRRTINGTTRRYIERFQVSMREALDTADKAAWVYSDSSVKKNYTVGDTPTATITGLSHLNGKNVVIWGGVYNATLGTVTYGRIPPVIDTLTGQPSVVASGQITVQTSLVGWVVGLPYTSTLVPERVEAQLSDGTSQGRKMRIPRFNAKIYQSFGGEYSSDGIKWYPMVARTTTDNMDDSPDVINGYTRMFLSSNWSDGTDIYLRQTLPVPFTIAALVCNWEASEGGN